jgi:hypothetical protein
MSKDLISNLIGKYNNLIINNNKNIELLTANDENKVYNGAVINLEALTEIYKSFLKELSDLDGIRCNNNKSNEIIVDTLEKLKTNLTEKYNTSINQNDIKNHMTTIDYMLEFLETGNIPEKKEFKYSFKNKSLFELRTGSNNQITYKQTRKLMDLNYILNNVVCNEVDGESIYTFSKNKAGIKINELKKRVENNLNDKEMVKRYMEVF